MKEAVVSKLEGQQLAVVDMAIPDKSILAKTIREACVESGFFYLVNHGIDQQLIDEVFLQSKCFFDLPLDEKMTVSHDVNHRGYTPMAEETVDPLNSKQGDTKEGYYIGWEVSADDPLSVKPLHGPNQWPSDELLIGWRETMQKYYSEILNLGQAVASLIALALDLDGDFFQSVFTTPMVALRLLHYTAEPSRPEEGVFGCGAHSDYGLLTFLTTDSNPGLQICKDKDAVPRVWEDVAPMQGAFIVNLGDMLERWTNGLFRSTLHRVLSKGIDRYSVPVFYEPNFDTLVECLPTCCSASNPPKYPPIKSGDYLVGKYIDTHSGYDVTAKPMA
ncbi:unnamed protein product [Calypogeia fissa]